MPHYSRMTRRNREQKRAERQIRESEHEQTSVPGYLGVNQRDRKVGKNQSHRFDSSGIFHTNRSENRDSYSTLRKQKGFDINSTAPFLPVSSAAEQDNDNSSSKPEGFNFNR